jgi:hypothetical protein
MYKVEEKRLLQDLGQYMNIISRFVSEEHGARVGWSQLSIAGFLNFIHTLVFRI